MELPARMFQVNGVYCKYWIKEITANGTVVIWMDIDSITSMLGYVDSLSIYKKVKSHNLLRLKDYLPGAAERIGDLIFVSGGGIRDILCSSNRSQVKTYGYQIIQLLQILKQYDQDYIQTGVYPKVSYRHFNDSEVIQAIEIYINSACF